MEQRRDEQTELQLIFRSQFAPGKEANQNETSDLLTEVGKLS